MQVAGLRQGASWGDVGWGLFMARYIFPGADSSFPLHIYITNLEKAGFQVNNVRGLQYSHTLEAWYHNFNRATDPTTPEGKELCQKYPGEMIRLWKLFLAWSTIAAYESSAACRMITSHIDTPTYPREIFSDKVA
jgi:cyclopropane fatty-acyl-phospholipid synthase-like methyltransferase